MTEESGEIVVREGGSVTAIATDELDEDISVDLDNPQGPHVGVPSEAWVAYEGDVDVDVEERDIADDVETDGGVVANRVSLRQGGVGLDGDAKNFAVGIMAFAYAGAGYLWSMTSPVAALVTFLAAGLVTYLLLFWNQGGGDE